MNKKHPPKDVFYYMAWLALTLVILLPENAISQSNIGFTMSDKVDKVEVKFERFSNLIVVPVKLNNSITIKFILDTGAESAILTERVFAEILGLNFVREINIFGPGIIDSVKAFVASDVKISLSDQVDGNALNILVLEEDYLELHKNLGEEVFGILGYDLFSRFVVDINYDTKIITLTRPDKYRVKRSYKRMDIKIIDTKPYVITTFKQGKESDTVRMMVDTGASHAALLDMSATDHLVLPSKVIPTRLGRGLGGEIQGYIGRLDRCTLGGFEFDKMLISIPEQGAYTKAIKRGSRHGTIGGDLLSRFNVVFDYSNEKIYLRKGKNFNAPFENNMSGLSFLAEGEELDSIKVIAVEMNTPAQRADIRKGDIVLKINGYNLKNSSMSNINALLRKKTGLRIRAIILRDGEKIKKDFRLERLI